jgi:hypothetical protein
MHNGGPHGHHVDLLERTSAEVNKEVLGWTTRTSSKYWLLVLALAAVTVLGVIGFIMKAGDGGLDSHLPWGYLAAGLAFVHRSSLSLLGWPRPTGLGRYPALRSYGQWRACWFS